MGCLILGCPFLDVPGTCVFSLLVVGLGVLTWGAQHTEGWGGRRRGASPHCTLSGPLPHLGGDAPLPSLWARGARLGEDSRSGGVLCRPPPPPQHVCAPLCPPPRCMRRSSGAASRSWRGCGSAVQPRRGRQPRQRSGGSRSCSSRCCSCSRRRSSCRRTWPSCCRSGSCWSVAAPPSSVSAPSWHPGWRRPSGR